MDLSEMRSGASRRHPWETARTDAIERILRRREVRPRSILDVGCGDGYAGERLTERMGAESMWGVDLHLTDADCASRSGARTRYARELSAVTHHRFELGLLCDVIEHVEDDRALVTEVLSFLEPGGHLLVTVPSFQALFSSHDVALRHHRRYSLPQLESTVRAAGAEVVDGGYLFASLLPVRALQKIAESVKKPEPDPSLLGIGSWTAPELVTRGLELAFLADNSLLLTLSALKIKLPGLSSWVLCKKLP